MLFKTTYDTIKSFQINYLFYSNGGDKNNYKLLPMRVSLLTTNILLNLFLNQFIALLKKYEHYNRCCKFLSELLHHIDEEIYYLRFLIHYNKSRHILFFANCNYN